jgi:ubiquinone/menaquinone biosynthesis C-methylase UbiE
MLLKKKQINYITNKVANKKLLLIDDREKRAKKIIAVLKDHCGNLSNLKLLDMSCSTGFMVRIFGESVEFATGMDIDKTALCVAARLEINDRVNFVASDALQTCFRDASFDIVVCNQMYEHVPSAEKMMNEIYRILKEDGVCYFGATNRLKIIETHYGNIPFLSYFPKIISNFIIKKMNRGDEYYETLYTFWGLKKLVNNFIINDYTVKIIKYPEIYSAENIITPSSLKQKIAYLISKYAYSFLPGYIWILSKK